jgi:hypothetical protein
MERTYHVADDFLRPAFSKLISTTQSYTKSKELLTLALNASAGAGVDLGTTVNDLTQAYVGNTKGLAKYKLGLTKAELAGKSFDELQQIITQRMAGQASLAADTYAFKIKAIEIAAGNAQETIGSGLVEAFQSIIGKDKGINDATTAIDNMAASAKLAIIEVGKLIGKLTVPAGEAFFAAKGKAASGNSNPLFDFLYGKSPAKNLKGVYDPMQGRVQDLSKEQIAVVLARKKDDDLAIKRQQELAKLSKKQLKLEDERLAKKKVQAALDKANRALDFAGTIFDLDKIQLYAALQGKITAEDRDKLTLKLLLLNAENQTGEALNKSAAEATRLSEKILMNNGLVMTYDGIIKNLATAKNPFEGFDAYTKGVLEQIRQIQLALDALKMPALVPFIGTPFGQAGGNTGAPTARGVPAPIPFMGTPFGQAGGNTGPINGSDMGAPFVGTPFGQAGGNGSGYIGTPFGQTTINVSAGTIANPQEIQDIVQNAIQLANRSGNSTNYAGGI